MRTKRPLFSNLSNDTALTVDQLTAFAQKITGNALVCVSDQLSWHYAGKVTPIKTNPELFARLNKFADFGWKRNGLTKEEFFCGVKYSVPAYDWSSTAPHFPPLEGVLYTAPAPKAENTGKLDELVACFDPATDLDRTLVKAFILTLFWGGPCGKRPVFTITSRTNDSHRGRGSGKSTFVELCSKLVGGSMALRPTLSPDRVMSVLLSPSSMNMRVALLDNLKTYRFSSDFFESLITCETINGHRLHHGYAARPNYLTYAITVNGANFSKDMAERTVVVKLNTPDRTKIWYRSILRLIGDHRAEIIADIRWHLSRRPRDIAEFDRWELWSNEILARLPDPEDVIALIERRRSSIDEDDQATADYLQHVEACIRARDPILNPETSKLFIPSALMLAWLKKFNSQITSTGQVAGIVTQHLSDRIRKKNRSDVRGYLWTGVDAGPEQEEIALAYRVNLNP